MMRGIAELTGTIIIFFLFYQGILWAVKNVRINGKPIDPPTKAVDPSKGDTK